MADLELRRQRFLYVRAWLRMTFHDIGDLQSKRRLSKAPTISCHSREPIRGSTEEGKFNAQISEKSRIFDSKVSILDVQTAGNVNFRVDFPGEKGSKVAHLSSNASFLCTSSSGARPMCYWRKHKKIQCLRTVESSSRGSKTASFS